jgi:hypothetical protein
MMMEVLKKGLDGERGKDLPEFNIPGGSRWEPW